MKIAVAVGEDKQTIIKRTGQSAFFTIYEDEKSKRKTWFNCR